jgi:hypothetical protein
MCPGVTGDDRSPAKVQAMVNAALQATGAVHGARWSFENRTSRDYTHIAWE